MLSASALLAVLDSMAAQVDVLTGAFGTGTEIGTISRAAADNMAAIVAIEDATVQRDLAFNFWARADLLKVDRFYGSMQGAMIQRALDRHYGAEQGSLDRFLRASNVRVHPNLRRIGMAFSAANVFMPSVVDPVATYEGTGGGTGTFAAGSDIDRTLYAAAELEVVTTAFGAVDREIELTLETFDGELVTRAVLIPAGIAPGDALSVGAPGERFVGVRNITTVDGGGDATDRMVVRSRLERAIAL